MSALQDELDFLQDLEAAMFQALQRQEQMSFAPISAVDHKFVEDTLKASVLKVRDRMLDVEGLTIRSRPDKIDRLVEAYIKTAKVNHYLVRVALADYTSDDLDEAEQILIRMDNEADNQDPDLNLALDILEHDRKTLP